MRRRLVETREKEILEQEAEEEEICRICHSSGDSKNPLKYPCACSGSIKFVHSKCLLRWMKQRITLKCEVCNHKYSVHRVYAENTPTILPPREFLCGIAMKACHVAPYCVRICFSVLNQLLILPYIAFWIWRSSVANSLSEAKELLVHSLMFPSTFMIMDWLYVLLIGNIISLLVMWLCSFVEIYAPFLVGPQPGNRNRNADEVREDAEVERQAIAGGLRNCDLVELWLTVFVALLRYFRGLIISVFRLAVHDPVWRTVIYLFTCILFFLISNNVLMSLRLGRMQLQVLAETLMANSTRPGEDLSSVGKPLLVYPSSGLYDVITGYMVVVPWMLLVVLHIPIRTVTSKIRGRLRKFLTTMIYPFFLMIHLGALPLVYGCWLDVCTITMLGRYTFLLAMFGGFCVTKVYTFFYDLADPICIILRGLTNDVQVQASKFLFSIAVNGVLIVFLVYLPAILAMRLAPTIFPLHISVSDPFTEIPVVMLLLQICLPYAIELRETVEALLHQWITAVCCTLGLSVFLFSRPEDIGRQENVKVERQQDRLQDRLIAAKGPNRNIFTFNGSTFVFRVVLLIFLVWTMLLLFSSSSIIVSIPLGHVLLSSISSLPITHGIKCNDLYAFFIGNVSIWTSFTGARYFIKHFKAGKAHLRFSDMCKWCSIIVESRVLLSLWIIVIPVLIGILFEFLFMEPIRAIVVEAPVLLLCQDWAVGLFFFKLWRTLVLLNHRIVLVDESWRIKFERVRDNGILKLPGCWMLQEILIPIVMNLLMSLCLLYVLARGIVPLLGFWITVNSTWVAYVTIIVLFSCAKRFSFWITELHNSILADRYSGFGLQNFGEAAIQCENEIDKLVRRLSDSRGC